jgi:hypothetical protein
MDRSERVPQLYGYSVCLIAVVVILISVTSIVNQAFAIADPLSSGGRYGWGGTGSLTSFEAYRATRDRGANTLTRPVVEGESPAAPREPTEAELRAEYEALRADRIAGASFEARQELTRSGVLLVVAIALFWWHWRWVRGAEMRAIAARAATRP